MARRESYADLKIRATDQFSATLNKGRAALEKFQQTGSRKANLQAIIAQKNTVRELEAEIKKLQATYRGYAQQLNSGQGTRQMGVDAVMTRARIGELRQEIGKVRTSVQQLRGGQATFREWSAAVNQTTGSVRQQIATNRQAVEQLRRTDAATGKKAQSQRTLKNEVDKATRSLRDQNSQLAMNATQMANTGRAAKQNWGSDVIGEDQEVMAFGLRPYQLTNLSYQVNDVVSGLAMGQAPLQIFAQQLGQVVQIFPSFARGMMGVFGFLERYWVLAGAAAAVGAVFVAALVRIGQRTAELNEQAQNLSQFEQTLAVLGERGEFTAEGLAKTTDEITKLGVATKEARDIVRDFINNGVREDRMADVANVASDLARILGIEIPDAASKLAVGLTGGFEAVRDLNEEMNLLTAEQFIEARRIFDTMGQVAGQEFVFGILRENADNARQSLIDMRTSTDELRDAWSDLIDTIADGKLTQSVSRIATEFGRLGLKGLADVLSGDAFDPENDNIRNRFGDLADEYIEASDAANSLLGRIGAIESLLSDGLSPDQDKLRRELELLEKEYEKTRKRMGEIVVQNLDAGNGEPTQPGIGGLSDDDLKIARDDLNISIRDTITGLAAETVELSKNAKERELAALLQEKENEAREAGLPILANGTRLTEEQTAYIRSIVDAKYEEIDAQEKLKAAQLSAQQIIKQTTGEYESARQIIEEVEAAIALMAEEFGATDSRVLAAQRALSQFRAEANAAEAEAYSLANAAHELNRALATLGSFQADLDSRLAGARRKLEMVEQGYSEARIRATEEVQRAISDEIDTMMEQGYTMEQVARRQEELISLNEKVIETENRAAEAMREAFSVSRSGGGGGGGGGGQDQRQVLEQQLNDILQYRTVLLQEIDRLQGEGRFEEAAGLRVELERVNQGAVQAIDNMLAFLGTLSGPEIQAAILQLQKLREEVTSVGTSVEQAADTWNRETAKMIASGFDSFAKDIANGVNAVEALRNAFLQFASDFLRKIAQMILEQAALNALQAMGFGDGVTGLLGRIGVPAAHSGGIIGSLPATRMVNPAIFANAARYHGGGIVGGEVPAILKRGEEVLTEDDPRHAGNGGGSPNVTVKNVNVIDPGQMVEAALQTTIGEQAFFNFITRNSRSISGALSG